MFPFLAVTARDPSPENAYLFQEDILLFCLDNVMLISLLTKWGLITFLSEALADALFLEICLFRSFCVWQGTFSDKASHTLGSE